MRCSSFLDASTHLYKRVCPSVGLSVGPSVRNHIFFISESHSKSIDKTSPSLIGTIKTVHRRNTPPPPPPIPPPPPLYHQSPTWTHRCSYWNLFSFFFSFFRLKRQILTKTQLASLFLHFEPPHNNSARLSRREGDPSGRAERKRKKRE